MPLLKRKTRLGLKSFFILSVFIFLISPLSGIAQYAPETPAPAVHRLTVPVASGYDSVFDGLLLKKNIMEGTDKDAAQLLKRLNGIIVQDNPAQRGLQILTISGMGERYNQVLFNGAPFYSPDPTSKAYAFSLLPSSSIETISLQKTGNPSLPADFTGGSLNISTRDQPDSNFFFIRVQGGYSEGTTGKDFYGDKRGSMEWLGFPGGIRNLPPSFPTSRSPYFLNQKNPQEQVFLAQQLKNNLAPVNHGASLPDDKILVGFGRIFRLKKGEKIGITAYLQHGHTELTDLSTVQGSPAVAANPFPFDPGKPVVASQSADRNYRYSSGMNGALNASIVYGRSKISFRNLFANTFTNTYTQRTGIFKPDEDTLAHTGIRYITEERRSLLTQLAGEHALGPQGKLRLDWQATYSWQRLRNPDERNFLLRQDSSHPQLFSLAVPVSSLDYGNTATLESSFTNSGRAWRELKDQNFSGSVNLLIPFNVFDQPQVLSGGIAVSTRYRVFHSDLFLIGGPGFFPLDGLLAAERFYPGGASVQNYFVNPSDLNHLQVNNRANYVASANLGSAYIFWQNHLSRTFSVNWGVRMESNSQLVSDTRYSYATGFRYPQISTNNENLNVGKTDILPSVRLSYQPVSSLRIHTSWFRSLNRPELQELADYRYYDASSFLIKTGNPNLFNSYITNYDAGIDWFADSGTHFSVSGFFKEIDQPIEYILSNYSSSKGNLLSTPHNSPPATIRGLNGSFTFNFGTLFPAPWFSRLSVFANGSWLNTKVDAGPVRSSATPYVTGHSLSGSPDYTLNAGLMLQYPRLPMIAVLYNRTGDYISALGSGATFPLPDGHTVRSVPDFRVKGRERLDIQLSQKLFSQAIQIIAGVSNLLNGEYIVYQDLNGNKKLDAPLSLTLKNGQAGFFQSGVDNTIIRVKEQRSFYFSISYLFK
ncbi:TonB-dependent receptor domain-containing protein [Flavitalea flava]